MSREIFAETDLILLGELLPSDDNSLFELNSDEHIFRYLWDNVTEDIKQCREEIRAIRQQYIDNGIGRWAIIEKSTNNFVGWAGLKLEKEVINNHTDFYNLGLRLMRKYWNKGYATDATKASIDYGFGKLNINAIYSEVDIYNIASKKVLIKAGFRHIETFKSEGYDVCWFGITKAEWEKLLKK